MEHLLAAIEETVKREGIDLIGFAPKSRFDGLKQEVNPFSVFPEGKTVILIGNVSAAGRYAVWKKEQILQTIISSERTGWKTSSCHLPVMG